MRAMLVAATLVLLTVACSAQAPDGYELVASFNFSDGLPEGIEIRPTSEWQVEDGVLTITKVGSQGEVRSPFSYVSLVDVWAGDLVLTFRAKCHTDPEVRGRDICGFLGMSDDTHFTYVHFSNASDEVHNAILEVDGADRAPLELIEEPEGKLTTGDWHTIKVERTLADGVIKGYVDDMETPCLVAVDPEPWAGKVGVGAFDDLASLDDIQLYLREDRMTIQDILAPDAEVRQVATGFRFTEGPSWDARAGLLKFSDIPNNCINTVTPEGDVGVFIEDSRNSNGTFYDARDGSLLACRHDGRDVVRYAADGSMTVLAAAYHAGKFNSPNDCVLTSTGAIYFTDPSYGLGDRQAEQELEGVYRLDPDGKVTRVIDDMTKPNGILISPDEKWLYVADSIDMFVKAYKIDADGMCSEGRVLGELKAPEEGVPDGMAMDTEGRIYCTGSGGVWVFTPQGEFIGRIMVPEPPSNCIFGGDDGSTLYMTARTSVYSVETQVKGYLPPVG